MPNCIANAVRVIVAVLLAFVAWPAAAQAPIWSWTNEHGSVLAVSQYNIANGQITGTFTSNAPKSCDVGKPLPMSGYLVRGAKGSAITFTVSYQTCDSAVVWTGPINPDSSFQALWLLSIAGPVQWNSIATGADVFTLKGGDPAKLRK